MPLRRHDAAASFSAILPPALTYMPTGYCAAAIRRLFFFAAAIALLLCAMRRVVYYAALRFCHAAMLPLRRARYAMMRLLMRICAMRIYTLMRDAAAYEAHASMRYAAYFRAMPLLFFRCYRRRYAVTFRRQLSRHATRMP